MSRTVPPQDTLAGYDRWASSYDTAANPLMAATARVLDLAPLGCRGLDVVELGCGTGRNAARVLGDGARSYTGVDGSPGMLARARAAYPGAQARWLRHDLHRAWATTDRFDLAFVVLVLEHLTELAPLAATLRAIAPRVRIVDIHPALVARGTVAHFHDGGDELRFSSVAHSEADLRAAFTGWTVEVRSWLADEAMIAAVPPVAKHRGLPIVIDVAAAR